MYVKEWSSRCRIYLVLWYSIQRSPYSVVSPHLMMRILASTAGVRRPLTEKPNGEESMSVYYLMVYTGLQL
jgi:hypothetical protein